MFRKNINWNIFFLKSEKIYFKIFHFLKYTHWSNVFAFYFKSSSKLSSILKTTSFLILYIFTVFLRNVLSFIIELSGPLSGFPYVQFKWHYLQLTNLLSHSRSCLFSPKRKSSGSFPLYNELAETETWEIAGSWFGRNFPRRMVGSPHMPRKFRNWDQGSQHMPQSYVDFNLKAQGKW